MTDAVSKSTIDKLWAGGGSSDYINVLLEDCNGNILIGTDNGVVIYDYQQDSFKLPQNDSILNDRVYSMCADSHGIVWIGARKSGIFCYNPHTGEITQQEITTEDGHRMQNIYRIAIGRNDALYVYSYSDNLYSLNPEDGYTKAKAINNTFFRADNIEGLSTDPQRGLFVASKRNGLCEVDLNTGDVKELYPMSHDIRPVGLYIDIKSSTLWLSTTSGLVRYSYNTGASELICYDADNPFSLSDNYVSQVILDSNEGLWVGTANAGVNYHKQSQDLFQKFYNTSDNVSLKGCSVSGFAEDKYGNVWIATENEGLLRYDSSHELLLKYTASKSLPTHINAVYSDGDYLWIGFHNGICRLNIETEVVKVWPHFISQGVDIDNRVLDIFKSSKGVLYVATATGVMTYNPAKDMFYKIEDIESTAIEDIIEDNNAKIWLASYNRGIFLFNPETQTVESHWCEKDDESNVPEMMSSLCIDDKGQVWALGFSSGFFKYRKDKKEFEVFDNTTLKNLPTEVFFSGLTDKHSNLWLSSEKGLVVYNDVTKSVDVFDNLSGLLEKKFRKASLRLSNGKMLFGSQNGFILFDPDDFRNIQFKDKLLISDFIVGNKSVTPSDKSPIKQNIDITKSINLKTENSSFGFTLARPDSDPSFGRVLCRLEGYDQWQDISTTMKVYYYNIPAGTYSLKFKIVGENGKEVRAHEDLLIVIHPPFWQSIQGILTIIAMVIMVSIGGFFYFYRRQLRRHRELFEQTAKDKELETMQEKMAFLANVVSEIKTPLSLINTPLHSILSVQKAGPFTDDLRIIGSNAKYLNRLVGELSEYIHLEQKDYILSYRKIDIIDRLNYLCLAYQRPATDRNIRIVFKHDMDSLPSAVDSNAFDKIINSLLGNAVRYAYSHIWISVEKADPYQVIIQVENDGMTIPASKRDKIFKPFVQFTTDKSNPYSQTFGMGLSLARTLAELHEGSLILANSKSTNFVLTLPIKEVMTPAPLQAKEGSAENPLSKNLPILVVAVDNTEFLLYLRKKLKREYNILTANSGEKVLDLLSRYTPDLIVTDIALSGMNGVTLCRKISNDFNYSHIPIIVLSSIPSEETKIKCIEYGAIQYIEKPFTLDYLLTSIKSALNQRQQLKKSMRGTLIHKTGNQYNFTNRDEEMLGKLDKIIGENISNPDFTVTQLEEAMFMSRSSLTRKIKGIYGVSPVEYICNRRLLEAADLLKRKNLQISEICYAVGFNSPSYFAKKFKSVYGKLPSEYAEEYNNANKTNSPINKTN